MGTGILNKKDGFHGHLYRPVKDKFEGKAILVLGGGGVPYQSTLDEADAFAKIGVTALAVGYFGVKDAPGNIVEVPVEYVEKAADTLHEKVIKIVIVAGISKGAEMALVSASLLSQINGVIAFSPSQRVYMGVGSGISWENASSWSYRGKALPYAYAPYSGFKALWNSLWAKEVTFRQAYEKADEIASKDSIIPVEEIKGPVLLAASLKDSLWPSEQACEAMIKRLEDHQFAYPYKKLIYPYASHLLLPFETGYEGLFPVGRKYPEACKKTIEDLKNEVLAWIELC